MMPLLFPERLRDVCELSEEGITWTLVCKKLHREELIKCTPHDSSSFGASSPLESGGDNNTTSDTQSLSFGALM